MIALVLMALISGKMTGMSMRSNQIREIRGLVHHHLAPAEEEDAPSLHGREGRDAAAQSGPVPWAARCRSRPWSPGDEAADGPGERGDSRGLRGTLREGGVAADMTAL